MSGGRPGGFGRRIFAVLALAVLVPCGAFMLIHVARTRTWLRESEQIRLELKARLVAQNLRWFFSETMADLRKDAALPLFSAIIDARDRGEPPTSRQRERMAFHLGRRPYEAFLRSRELRDRGGERVLTLPDLPVPGASEDLPLFREIALRGQSLRRWKGADAAGGAELLFVAPVAEPGTPPSGILVLRYDGNVLTHLLTQGQNEDLRHADVVILDDRGAMVASGELPESLGGNRESDGPSAAVPLEEGWSVVVRRRQEPGASDGMLWGSSLLFPGALLLLLALGGAFWLARSLAAPLRRLTESARAFAEGNLDVRVTVETQDEIGALATIFNDMACRITHHISRLEESEERYRSLFDHMLDGFALHEIILDQEGHPENYRFLAVNPAFERLTGLRGEAIVGRTVKEALPRTEQHWIDAYGQVALTGNPATFENFSEELGCFFEVTAYSPAPGFFACIFSDVTARRRAEEALVESEERLRLALDAASDGLWDWNVATGEAYWGPRTYTMLGYDPGEFPASFAQWGRLVHPEDRERTVAQIQAHLDEGKPGYAVEFRMQTREGGWRWILARGKVIERDASGAPRRMVGTHADITDRKHAEEERRKLEQYLRNIVDSMPSLLVGVDVRGRVTQWNAEAERRTGVSRNDAVGCLVQELLPLPGHAMERLQEALSQRLLQKVERVTLDDAEGRQRFADVLVYPLVANGVTGAVMRVDDVTERVRLEEIMVQTEKMMSVGGLAAGMAHEINNPLGGILQGTQTILRRLDPGMEKNVAAAVACGTSLEAVRCYLESREILTFLQGIRESGERAAGIVTNMLAFSRQSDAVKTPCALKDLVDRAVALAATDFDLRRQYDFRKIALEREDDPALPPVFCVVTEIEQVLLNLLKNAAQALSAYSQDQPPRIRVTTKRDGDRAVIEVRDNGPGVPEALQHRIFEPFFTTKEVGVGTGLGLSVSYFIVHTNHGGELLLARVPEGGAAFSVRLPLEGGE